MANLLSLCKGGDEEGRDLYLYMFTSLDDVSQIPNLTDGILAGKLTISHIVCSHFFS